MNKFLIVVFFLLIPVFAHSATYYVAKTGSGSTCSQAAPCLTIATGIGNLASGDTLIVHSGTYVESISAGVIPSGTSWETATKIQVATGEVVILRPTSGSQAVWFGSQKYIIFDGFIIDAINLSTGIRFQATTSGEQSVHHIRVQNCEVKNANGTYGIGHTYREQGGHHLEILNCDVHDNGTSSQLDHGIYFVGQDNLISGNRVYNNSSHGIHVFWNVSVNDRTIVKNNISHGNGSRGILIGGGEDVTAFNNIVYGNGISGDGSGITIGFTSPQDNAIYNNTIYDNAVGCIDIRSGSTGSIIRNNICWSNGSDIIANLGTNTITSNNLFINPSFIDASVHDLHLQSGSDAINIGFNLSGIVDSDFDGNSRPINTNWDIGAYEFVSSFFPSVITDQSTYTTGNTITVTVDDGLGGLNEWVGIWVASNPDSSLSFEGNWKYINNSQTPPGSPISYPAQITFVAPVSGAYNIRYFAQNGTSNRLAISSDFTISGDGAAPTNVSIVDPLNDAIVQGSILISSSAEDGTAIGRVEAYYDTTNFIGTDSGGPDCDPYYCIIWHTEQLADGDYALTIIAYDTSENSTTSSAVMVTVSNFVEFITDGIIDSVSGLDALPFFADGSIDSVSGLSLLPVLSDGSIDSVLGLSSLEFTIDGTIDSVFIE